MKPQHSIQCIQECLHLCLRLNGYVFVFVFVNNAECKYYNNQNPWIVNDNENGNSKWKWMKNILKCSLVLCWNPHHLVIMELTQQLALALSHSNAYQRVRFYPFYYEAQFYSCILFIHWKWKRNYLLINIIIRWTWMVRLAQQNVQMSCTLFIAHFNWIIEWWSRRFCIWFHNPSGFIDLNSKTNTHNVSFRLKIDPYESIFHKSSKYGNEQSVALESASTSVSVLRASFSNIFKNYF